MKFINCAQPHCKSIKTRFIFHILTLQHKHAKPQVQRKTGKFAPCHPSDDLFPYMGSVIGHGVTARTFPWLSDFCPNRWFAVPMSFFKN